MKINYIREIKDVESLKCLLGLDTRKDRISGDWQKEPHRWKCKASQERDRLITQTSSYETCNRWLKYRSIEEKGWKFMET